MTIYGTTIEAASHGLQFSAGANRGTLRLRIDGLVVTINDRKAADAPDLLVIWHAGSAGTWHGFASEYKTRGAMKKPEDPRGFWFTSTSGGGDGFAGVVKVPPEGILFVTSGYDGRRGWTVHSATFDGTKVSVESVPRDEWFARFAAVEVL